MEFSCDVVVVLVFFVVPRRQKEGFVRLVPEKLKFAVHAGQLSFSDSFGMTWKHLTFVAEKRNETPRGANFKVRCRFAAGYPVVPGGNFQGVENGGISDVIIEHKCRENRNRGRRVDVTTARGLMHI